MASWTSDGTKTRQPLTSEGQERTLHKSYVFLHHSNLFVGVLSSRLVGIILGILTEYSILQ